MMSGVLDVREFPLFDEENGLGVLAQVDEVSAASCCGFNVLPVACFTVSGGLGCPLEAFWVLVVMQRVVQPACSCVRCQAASTSGAVVAAAVIVPQGQAATFPVAVQPLWMLSTSVQFA